MKLAEMIQKRLKCNTIMTRTKDTYISLEGRTAIANTRNADCSSPCIAMQRKTKNCPELKPTFSTWPPMMTPSCGGPGKRHLPKKYFRPADHSQRSDEKCKNHGIRCLGPGVQKTLCAGMKKHYSHVQNLGVKQAPFLCSFGGHHALHTH